MYEVNKSKRNKQKTYFHLNSYYILFIGGGGQHRAKLTVQNIMANVAAMERKDPRTAYSVIKEVSSRAPHGKNKIVL